MPAVARAPEAPPPADLPVTLHPAVRVLADGRVLAGGSPFRVVRLTDQGAAAVAAWTRPAPVGADGARRRLARRLIAAGLLAPQPTPATPMSDLTVVIPVRDRARQLERCLSAVAAACPGVPVVTVDDGSRDPESVRAACERHGARVLRHAAARGAAAARNSGLAAAATPFVCFVDSDVVLPVRTPRILLGHLADPAVAAVAPRVRALPPAHGLIGGYEDRHSALDMGPEGGSVAVGRPLSYVPSTVLLVRRSAVGAGFDETLEIGEDVDLVWRLSAAGWDVRYVPEAEVWHDHRVRLVEFVARRHLYARSCGMLARRHPDALAAMWVSPALAVPWCLLVAGHRPAALASAVAATIAVQRRLPAVPGGTLRLAVAVTARGIALTGLALAQALRRAWSPVLAVAAVRGRRARTVLLAGFATAVVQDIVATRRVPACLGDVPVRLLDEIVAAVGTWDGCLRERTLRPLLPARHRMNRTATA